jgi:hypothetical protein
MMVRGKDFILRLVSGNSDIAVPFCGATVRERVVVLEEKAGIEGEGRCGGYGMSRGLAGGLRRL